MTVWHILTLSGTIWYNITSYDVDVQQVKNDFFSGDLSKRKIKLHILTYINDSFKRATISKKLTVIYYHFLHTLCSEIYAYNSIT